MGIPSQDRFFISLEPPKDRPVDHPTWYGDIRYMFSVADVAHMRPYGLDLTNYDAVVESAGTIHGQIATGRMPKGSPWPLPWRQTFLNWMIDEFPKGNNPFPDATFISQLNLTASVDRTRKDIATLCQSDISLLAKAFSGIMSKDLDDPNSYFTQAGHHWLPAPLHCQHHVPAYSPWHRAYLMSFENALRSVPGCESVTLPYWDITTPFPDVLKTAPFDSYVLPQDIGGGYLADYRTERYSYPKIQNNLKKFDVSGDIDRAMRKTSWEDFHGLLAGSASNTIIQAHDSGHLAIGPTMKEQEVTAFDPIFWFFHCNWDRLFWRWQQSMNAVTVESLLTTISSADSRNIFTIPALQALAPFTKNMELTTVNLINSRDDLGVDYEEPEGEFFVAKSAPLKGSLPASKGIRIAADRVNIRVKGLDRMKIPGSFEIHLLKDGKVIASRGFFQPVETAQCSSCVKNAIVHFDFDLPIDAVADGVLRVEIEPSNKGFIGNIFPQSMAGNPKIDARLLLQDE